MFEFIFNYVEEDAFYKYLRLTIVVCCYLIFRLYYSNWAKNKAVQQQVAQDEKEKKEKPEKEKAEKEAQEQALKKEAAAFGWGKKTRQSVKQKQAALEEQLDELRQRHQSSYDAQEDHDIEDLLED